MIATAHGNSRSFQSTDPNEIVLRSALELKGKQVQLSLSKDSEYVCWSPLASDDPSVPVPENAVNRIPVKEIFAVTYESINGKNKRSKSIELLPGTIFCIHYIKRDAAYRWKDKGLYFHCSDTQECQMWVKALNSLLDKYERPKHLLIFVNPVGGKKLGKKVFSEKVYPLFETAGIKQDVIITERARHAEDHLLSAKLDQYDGIISVGGDGMFSEILNGFLQRTLKSNNGKEDTNEVKKKIKLGAIPAGSTDTVVFCTVGANDPVTSALHIILGDSLPLDVCSVSHGQSTLRYCVSLMGYGFFGDVMKSSEKFRWLGPRRYDIAGFMKFMANRSYCGEVSFLPAPTELSNPKEFDPCRSGCTTCAAKIDETDGLKDSWKTTRGKFISIIGANITCRCAKSLNGISPGAHLGDGFLDLILIRNTSRSQYFRHMLQLANSGDPFNFNFVEVFRVKEFRYKPLHTEQEELEGPGDKEDITLDLVDSGQTEDSNTPRIRQTSLWNIDGELIEEPGVRVRAHRQLVTIFARGIEQEEETTTTCRPCQKKP